MKTTPQQGGSSHGRTTPEDGLLITMNRAAEILGYCRHTIQKFVREGRLQKVHGRLRLSDVLALAEKRNDKA